MGDKEIELESTMRKVYVFYYCDDWCNGVEFIFGSKERADKFKEENNRREDYSVYDLK